jgi:hypothetical protein
MAGPLRQVAMNSPRGSARIGRPGRPQAAHKMWPSRAVHGAGHGTSGFVRDRSPGSVGSLTCRSCSPSFAASASGESSQAWNAQPTHNNGSEHRPSRVGRLNSTGSQAPSYRLARPGRSPRAVQGCRSQGRYLIMSGYSTAGPRRKRGALTGQEAHGPYPNRPKVPCSVTALPSTL